MGFQQGLSGLNASSKNLEVIGNNIANANTYGAKSARAEFADMYANAMNGTGANNIGIGVTVASVAQQFTQGNIAATQNPLDVAINGAGFFQVQDGEKPALYTRNGQFRIDRDGYVVNAQGYKLLGFAADSNGNIVSGQRAGALRMPTGLIDPNPTSKVTMELNLDSRADAVTVPTTGAAVSFSDPTTYTSATSVTVYDQKGQQVALTYYFQKDQLASATPDAAGVNHDVWNLYITADGTPLQGTAALPQRSMQLTFDATTGQRESAATSTIGPLPPTLPQGITLDLTGVTQYGAPYAVTNLNQDGSAAGQLIGAQVEADGIVMARYSNGDTKPSGQVELVNFRNPQGLQPMGGNAWARTFAAGDRIPGTPGSGNLGTLQSGALEESNVDMTAELVNMITAQRVYQANAQTIKTQDQVMQTLVNLR